MSDDPKKTHKKYAGASDGLSGVLSGAGGARAPEQVVVADKMADDELREVASTRKSDKHAKPAVAKGFLSGKNAGKLYENADGSYGSTEQANAISDSERSLILTPLLLLALHRQRICIRTCIHSHACVHA